MFKNNKYNFTAFLLWSAYFCHGIQALLISQNAKFFAVKWNLISQANLTDPAKLAVATGTVLAAVAWTGWGKLSFLAFSGPLSDKIGRKPLIVLGLLGYVLMFASFLFATNITLVNFLAFIGGAMTSFYDGAINPALFEMYPENKSTASVLGKTFISVSSILYPLVVAFVATNGLAPEIGIWIPLVLSALVFAGVLFAQFPDLDLQKAEGLSASEAIKELEKRQNVAAVGSVEKANHSKFALDGTVLSIFALTIYSNFYLFQQASKIYATNVLNMSEGAAASVTSLYQLGGLVATFVFAIMMARGVRDMAILAVSPIFAGLAGLLVYFIPSPATLTIAGIIVGFCAAGGLLQMGNGVLNQFFDTNKGRNTSVYYFVMALGSIIIPKAAGSLIAAGKGELIMLIMAGTGIVSAALMFFAGTRYSHIFGVSPFSNSKKG
ncbi:MFS family permease [Streptococcus gallinaceus]|uniref:MFS transporter n=1 Tax=Streptococcus gallinaceus TaxID=165758 RepID=UPI00209CB8FB|nr:MFS transporter [Streptococcus gallinaceus]MCP1639130.1 MFS family permease [Streptococcus gallinaceus]MCP1769626.1 MFS family permease [Streptococcus gallinaceus]